jgi:serine/threonine-protein kinase
MAEVILTEMSVGGELTKLAVLKRMWPHLASQPDFISMFLHEAGLCIAMNHPNVVQTYEVLDHAERPAIVMEYLDGQPLSRVLNRLVGPGALSLAMQIRIVVNLLAALDYVHRLCDYHGAARGVVHRDVNPQNVFLTYGGQVKLVDFGVARSFSNAAQPGRGGAVHGKLAYMAPEQLLGGEIDRRADLFSVGVVLWEMVGGRRLWQGMTEGTIVGHLTTRAPIPELPGASKLPPALADALAQALSYDPADRQATAAEFQSQLEPLLAQNDGSHGRRLGHVVSLAFAQERSTRQALIERHLNGADITDGPARIEVGSTSEPSPTESHLPLESLRPARPTPGGMWTLSDPFRANVTPSADATENPEPPGEPGDRTLAVGFIPPGVSPAMARGRWAALGVCLAVLVVAGGLVMKSVARRAVAPLTVNVKTEAFSRSAPTTAVVAPIRARSVIPWPILVPPAASPGWPASDGTLRDDEGLSGAPSGSTARRSHGLQGADGSSVYRPRQRRSDAQGEKPPGPLPGAEDEVLEPTIDLSEALLKSGSLARPSARWPR